MLCEWSSGKTVACHHFIICARHPTYALPRLTPTKHSHRPPAFTATPRVLLSINRFERKKDLAVAIRAFAAFRRDQLQQAAHASLGHGGSRPSARVVDAHLVMAGGYDTRVAENVEHYAELVRLAAEEGLLSAQAVMGHSDALSSISFPPRPSSAPPLPYSQVESSPGASITFVRSFSDEQKATLLAACCGVVYTPSNEHFGIVPLECMAARRPVVAAASGGPLESVVHGQTGFLCDPPTPHAFAECMSKLVSRPAEAAAMGAAGAKRVADCFSRDAFAAQLEVVCRRAMGEGTATPVGGGGSATSGAAATPPAAAAGAVAGGEAANGGSSGGSVKARAKRGSKSPTRQTAKTTTASS